MASYSNNINRIPISSNTMITTRTTSSISSLKKKEKRENTLSKFIHEYIFKVSQIIVSSRSLLNKNNKNNSNNNNTDLMESWNDLTTSTTDNNNAQSSWFRIKMNDVISIQKYISTECIGLWNCRLNDFSLTIDISLSAESLTSHVLLERWKIKFKSVDNILNSNNHLNNNNNLLNDPSLIYKRMTIQIRSILSYLRILPTHSIVKSWEELMNQQSMMLNNKDHQSSNSNNNNMVPFAIYHLIYSHYNKQQYVNNGISSFKNGKINNYCFNPIHTIFGSLRTTVFYANNIDKDFEFLIRNIPGNNPPKNLSLNYHSKYFNKNNNNNNDNNDDNNDFIDNKNDDNFNDNNSSPYEVIASPQNKLHNMLLDNINISTSPPIKSININFHESPLLNPNIFPNKNASIDPQKEIQKIRLSTICGQQPPVISLNDVSIKKDRNDINDINNNNISTFGSSSLMFGMKSTYLTKIVQNNKQIIISKNKKKQSIMPVLQTLQDQIDQNNNNNNNNMDDDVFGDLNINSNCSLSINNDVDPCSDHDDIQNELFNNNDDISNNDNNNNISVITDFINLCNNANKLQLNSFKVTDKLLINKNNKNNNNNIDNKNYFNLITQHFKMRQDKLIKLQKISSNVLSNSITTQKS